MVEYRDVLTATLVYDQVPVLDYLRAIDSDTIVATGSIYTIHVRNKSGSARLVLTA